MNKRIFSLFLAALLTMSIISCGASQNEDDTPSPPDNISSLETEAAVETETENPLNIPKEDNNGRNFLILVPTEKAYEFVSKRTER